MHSRQVFLSYCFFYYLWKSYDVQKLITQGAVDVLPDKIHMTV